MEEDTVKARSILFGPLHNRRYRVLSHLGMIKVVILNTGQPNGMWPGTRDKSSALLTP